MRTAGCPLFLFNSHVHPHQRTRRVPGKPNRIWRLVLPFCNKIGTRQTKAEFP